MNKFLTAVILAVFAQSVVSDYIPLNGLCDGFAGPVGTCAPGLTCCEIHPDDAICLTECPVPIGGQCGTIAGTKPCVGGIPCCYLHPDDGVCQVKCPKKM